MYYTIFKGEKKKKWENKCRSTVLWPMHRCIAQFHFADEQQSTIISRKNWMKWFWFFYINLIFLCPVHRHTISTWKRNIENEAKTEKKWKILCQYDWHLDIKYILAYFEYSIWHSRLLGCVKFTFYNKDARTVACYIVNRLNWVNQLKLSEWKVKYVCICCNFYTDIVIKNMLAR